MAFTPLVTRVVTALVLLAVLSVKVQAGGLIAPNTLIANQAANVTLSETLDKDSELRKTYNGYRVYLALTPPGWGTGPECWLADNLDLRPQQVSVIVPSDVVPNGTKVQFAASLIKKGQENAHGFFYSNKVIFQQGNGTWSQRELNGRNMADENIVNCQALGCVRRCNDQYYTGEESSEKAADDCSNQCVKDWNAANSGTPSFKIPAAATLVGIIAFLWLL
ncbi:unnamed protein product [Clonostachys byssicola]|uniref:Uncharacterized protein n=1 Tax=Clonostachys byssicola TaxID=160290 RepID=A0A9N9ULA7_9HYPO|nr:unnamed protein product [Clonostachys byssicola]